MSDAQKCPHRREVYVEEDGTYCHAKAAYRGQRCDLMPAPKPSNPLPAVPPEEWIEKMAIASAESDPGDPRWDEMDEGLREAWRKSAEWAYAALREEMEK